MASPISIWKQYIPAQFLLSITDDNMIVAYLNLVLAEINVKPPYTNYTLDNLPTPYTYIVAFGAQVFATLFLQAGYALQDFSYSDGGLSLNINRTSNLQTPYLNQYTALEKMIDNIKKIEALRVKPQTLLTPTFQTVAAQYLSSIFPGQFPLR